MRNWFQTISCVPAAGSGGDAARNKSSADPAGTGLPERLAEIGEWRGVPGDQVLVRLYKGMVDVT